MASAAAVVMLELTRAVSGSVSGTPHCQLPVPCGGSVGRQGGVGTAQGAQFWGCDCLSAPGAGEYNEPLVLLLTTETEVDT